MLAGRTYVPLLHARLAEMRALRELPTQTKNLMMPVVRIRPWLNSRSLSRAFDVVTDAIGDRAYALDLDDTKLDLTSTKYSHQQFANLFDESGAFQNYYKCVAEHQSRVPVVRRGHGISASLGGQLDHVEQLERGVVIRVETKNPGDYLECAQECLVRNIENVVFIFDCGWRQDVLTQAAGCVALVNNVLDISEDFEVVVAGSSFPDAFTGMGARAAFPIYERLLFQNVRQNINRGTLYYGDWASTRPPTDPVPMTNVPRIDIAGRSDWIAWRSEDGESYSDIAERVTLDPAWSNDTTLWGNYMIASTAEELDPAIRAPAMAAAVRVNLHMDVQARYDQPGGLVILDEPVGDDL